MDSAKPKTFIRGIYKTPILKLSSDFFTSAMGREIIHSKLDNEPVFQVCIRENYFNVYWNGCSVLKFKPNGWDKKYLIHYKYIGGKEPGWKNEWVKKNDPYIALTMDENGDLVFPAEKNWSFKKNIIHQAKSGQITHVDDYTHSGSSPGEKVLLNMYLKKFKPLLMDLEVAFARKRDPDEIESSKTHRPFVADRMDFAEIEYTDGAAPKLKLIEVKKVADSRLSSIPENNPEVLTQMSHYMAFITNSHEMILQSYKQVAKNMVELGIVDNKMTCDNNSVKDILKEFRVSGELDENPHLLVLGTEKDFSNKTRRGHLKRLTKLFAERNYQAPEYETL